MRAHHGIGGRRLKRMAISLPKRRSCFTQPCCAKKPSQSAGRNRNGAFTIWRRRDAARM